VRILKVGNVGHGNTTRDFAEEMPDKGEKIGVYEEGSKKDSERVRGPCFAPLCTEENLVSRFVGIV
jgi:hypothetical protein